MVLYALNSLYVLLLGIFLKKIINELYQMIRGIKKQAQN